jgi:PIN domain nuclease of toxin-antitoxin system
LLHGDPFDRIIVAQARVEGLRLITNDADVAAYDPTILLM